MRNKVKIGGRFKKMVITEDLGIFQKEGTSARRHYVRCKCDCGKEKVVHLGDLKSGRIQSCGCYNVDKIIERNRRYNKYYIFGETIFVKFSNSNRYFLCDLEDLHYVKEHCWYEDKHGYAISNINRKRCAFHRLVMNAPKEKEVDHIFQVSKGVCDNRKKNLRLCTHQENMENNSFYKNNTSGYTGVVYDKSKNKWIATISIKGRNKHLGLFDKIEDAIEARKLGEWKYRDKVI